MSMPLMRGAVPLSLTVPVILPSPAALTLGPEDRIAKEINTTAASTAKNLYRDETFIKKPSLTGLLNFGCSSPYYGCEPGGGVAGGGVAGGSVAGGSVAGGCAAGGCAAGALGFTGFRPS